MRSGVHCHVKHMREYLFDEARSFCKKSKGVLKDGIRINISGEGAWKELMVTNESSGEVLAEKKFYKADFGAIMRDEKYKKYVMIALDAALSIDPGDIEHIQEEEITSDE